MEGIGKVIAFTGPQVGIPIAVGATMVAILYKIHSWSSHKPIKKLTIGKQLKKVLKEHEIEKHLIFCQSHIDSLASQIMEYESFLTKKNNKINVNIESKVQNKNKNTKNGDKTVIIKK